MGVQVQDLNPGAQHQTTAKFTPGKSQAPPAPPQPAFTPPPKVAKPVPDRPAKAAVQRVSLTPEPTGPSIFDDMAADFGSTEEAVTPPAPQLPPGQPVASEDDQEIQSVLERFKGSAEDKLKALAKSYQNSEKRMRQLENERKLFTTGQQPSATPPTPAQQQVQVTPTFKYERFEKEILDPGKGAALAQDFEKHLVGTVDGKLAPIMNIVFKKLVDNDIFRKHGDVVNEENIDVIHAMAQNEPGSSLFDRCESAAKKYRAAMQPTPSQPNPDVAQMQQNAAMPTPQARATGGKKMYKESEIRAEMQRRMKMGGSHYAQFRPLADAAYREGRVLKGQ